MKKIFSILSFVLILLLLISCKSSDNPKLNKVKTYFDFPDIVTSDLDFPKEITIDDEVISLEWKTSDEAISNEGIVTRGSSDKEVKISVTATLGNDSLDVEIALVTVLKAKTRYTINYNLNGGIASNLVTSFEEGDVVNLPIPRKEGCTFIGWYEGTELVETIANRNYNLVAKWVRDKGSLSITLDEDVLYVGSESEITIPGYSDLSVFDIDVSNESVAYVDSDYFLICLNKGTVVITFTLRSDPSIYDMIEVEVLNKKPILTKDNKPVLVGDEFNIKLNNYNDDSLFLIAYDAIHLSWNDGVFEAIRPGETFITYTLKSDATTSATYELVIYPIEPVLSISSSDVLIGSTTRIDVLNYDNLDDLLIEVTTDTAEINGRIIKAIKRGDIRVTVSLVNNPEISSYLDIHVLPIVPKVYVSRDDIVVGGNSHIYFDNLEELDDKELANYEIRLSDDTIVSVTDYNLTGLKVGTSLVTIVNKNDPELTSTISVNVIQKPTVYDGDNEVASGKLYIKHKDNDDFDGYIHAGDMDYFEVFGSHDQTKYEWITSDVRVISVFEDGRYIAIGKGSASVVVTRKTNKEVVGKINIKVYGEPDIDYASRLIEIASTQLGYVEGPDNDTKYGTWYGLPNEEWCAMFVSWCANQSGISTEIIPRYASCTVGKNWFEERGLFKYKEEYTPKAGDIIFFLSDGAGHTGIVINCDGSRVYTIEGNTSDMCAKRSYDLKWHTITGYGTPDYPPFTGSSSGGDISGSTEGGGHSTH